MKTTRDTLYKAVYQYLADHTIPTDKGPAVSFILPTQSELKRRILYREKGYKRVDADDIIKDPMKYREQLPFVKHARKQVEKFKKADEKLKIKRNLKKNGTLKDKVIIYIKNYCDDYLRRRVREIRKNERKN